MIFFRKSWTEANRKEVSAAAEKLANSLRLVKEERDSKTAALGAKLLFEGFQEARTRAEALNNIELMGGGRPASPEGPPTRGKRGAAPAEIHRRLGGKTPQIVRTAGLPDRLVGKPLTRVEAEVLPKLEALKHSEIEMTPLT